MPPSVTNVLRGTPAALAALAVPIVALASSSLQEKLTDEEKAAREEETNRRAKILSEMIDILKKQSETFAKKEQSTGAEEKDEELQTKTKTESVMEDDDDDEGQLTFEDIRRRCMELVNIAPDASELELGIEWCAKLLLKELRVGARKTEQQKDIKYSDGKKLESILESPEALDDLAKQAKRPVPKQLWVDVQEARREARRVRRVQKRKDFMKAVQMIFLAKDALPWVLANSATSVMSASIGTMSLHYRAEVLQTLQSSNSSSRASFRKATLAMVSVELVAALARALESQLSARAQALMAKSIQVRLFQALMSKDMTWWGERKDPWELIIKVCHLPGHVQNALEMPRVLLNRVVSIFIQVALVQQQSSRMLYAMVGLHWVQVLVRKAINYLQERLAIWATRSLVVPAQDKFTWVHSLNPEYIQMYQSFAREPLEAKDLQKFFHGHNRRSELLGAMSSVCAPLESFAAQAGSIAEFSSMGELVRDGSIDLMQAETLMHYATQVGSEVEGAYSEVLHAQDKLEPLATAYDYIAIPPKIDPMVGVDPGQRASGHFVFEDVRFGYPGRKTEILKGVSFEAKPGQVVGITGTTGCGKSTCLRLIERFYDVGKGRILMDGKDIKEYKPQWLRAQIVAVAQEPKLLPLSIRDNLTFGCTSPPTIEEIERACRAANIWDILSDPQKFPNGLETTMSAVQNVAGGEKQRICIARAILADPPVLLLDEATSALDEVSQAQVQEALNKLMKGRTTLVVAHRLSTIKDADKIVAMHDGKVAEFGTHEELLAKPDGVWRKLWMEQGSQGAAAESQQPVTMQRTTTTTVGKFMVLRQAVAALAGDDEARASSVMDMIDELEVQSAECFESKLEEIGMISENVGSRPQVSNSKWGKLRALRKLGCLTATGVSKEREAEPPKFPRQASLMRAVSSKAGEASPGDAQGGVRDPP